MVFFKNLLRAEFRELKILCLIIFLSLFLTIGIIPALLGSLLYYIPLTMTLENGELIYYASIWLGFLTPFLLLAYRALWSPLKLSISNNKIIFWVSFFCISNVAAYVICYYFSKNYSI